MADEQADAALSRPPGQAFEGADSAPSQALQRAAQAHARAAEAASRAERLRARRPGEEDLAPGSLLGELENARSNAQSAHEHLLTALESSAKAHDRAAAHFDAQAAADEDLREELSARAVRHREGATADRERAEILRRAGA